MEKEEQKRTCHDCACCNNSSIGDVCVSSFLEGEIQLIERPSFAEGCSFYISNEVLTVECKNCQHHGNVTLFGNISAKIVICKSSAEDSEHLPGTEYQYLNQEIEFTDCEDFEPLKPIQILAKKHESTDTK